MKKLARIAALVIVLAVVLAGCAYKDNAPKTGPNGRALTQDDSKKFQGDVTAEVYFRYMGWGSDLSLSPVSPGSDRVSTSELNGHAWFFLGVGTAGVKGSSTSQTVDFYRFAITNNNGETVRLKMAQELLVFHQVVGVTPRAKLSFKYYDFYTKHDKGSIFADKAGRTNNSNSGQLFSKTAPAVLFAKYVTKVDVWLTPEEFTQLNTPGLYAAHIPGS